MELLQWLLWQQNVFFTSLGKHCHNPLLSEGLIKKFANLICCAFLVSVNCLKRLPDFPKGQGHLWAKVAYQLIANKGNWDQAAIAYFQFNDGEASKLRCVVNLKPFCNLPMLKGYAWGMDLMKYFLLCGSDRNSIQLEKGQPYLHAVVQMTLKVGKF